MKTSLVIFALSTLFFAVALCLKAEHPYPTQVCTSDQWVSQTHELIWTAGDNQFRTYDGTVFYDSDAFRLRVDTYAVTDDYNVSNIYDFYDEVMYTIYDGICYSTALSNTSELENCLPTTATFQSTFLIAGSNAVDSWVVDNDYYFQEFHIGEGSNIILSEVSYDTTYGNISFYDELVFINWVDGVVDPDAFVLPDNCKDAKPFETLSFENIYRVSRFLGNKLF